jgi:hypothetical protein
MWATVPGMSLTSSGPSSASTTSGDDSGSLGRGREISLSRIPNGRPRIIER